MAATMLICSAASAGAVSGVTTAPPVGNLAAPAQGGSSISTTPAAATPFVTKSTPTKAAAPTARQGQGQYNFFDSDFILRIRGTAVQPEADIPRPLVVGVGVSEVWLEKDIGGDVADCETYGAGYYAGEVAEQGILENSGPPDGGNKGGGIFNPTRSKDTKPNLSPGENLNSRKPQLRSPQDGSVIYELPHNGNGVRWEAECITDASAKATGNIVDVAGAEAVGSTTTGAVDKNTGLFTGTSRAYIAGLNTGTAVVDAISSAMQVKHEFGKAPLVSYRIAVNGGTLAEGVDVPYEDLTKQFNDAVNANGGAVASLATLGLTLMGPTGSRSEFGGGARYVLNAPFLEAMAVVPLREGTAGERTYARLVNIDYEGLYGGGAIKP